MSDIVRWCIRGNKHTRPSLARPGGHHAGSHGHNLENFQCVTVCSLVANDDWALPFLAGWHTHPHTGAPVASTLIIATQTLCKASSTHEQSLNEKRRAGLKRYASRTL